MFFSEYLVFSPVSLIPGFHIHISFIYHQCYIISATESIIQWNISHSELDARKTAWMLNTAQQEFKTRIGSNI
jgi:hypothetical protein